jgi:hypothetical protein
MRAVSYRRSSKVFLQEEYKGWHGGAFIQHPRDQLHENTAIQKMKRRIK